MPISPTRRCLRSVATWAIGVKPQVSPHDATGMRYYDTIISLLDDINTDLAEEDEGAELVSWHPFSRRKPLPAGEKLINWLSSTEGRLDMIDAYTSKLESHLIRH